MIYRSPHPDIEVPNITLQEFLFERAFKYTNKVALIDGPTGRTMTYGQLVEAVKWTAAGLIGRGFAKSDVLALYSPNLPEYAVAFFGAATAGGVTTTVNPLYTAAELKGQLVSAKAKFLVRPCRSVFRRHKKRQPAPLLRRSSCSARRPEQRRFQNYRKMPMSQLRS